MTVPANVEENDLVLDLESSQEEDEEEERETPVEKSPVRIENKSS